MKTIKIRNFGEADRLVLEDSPVPRPGSGEITIDVAFAGVGFVDTLVRSGVFDFAVPPLVPGIEVAGTVREVGDGVTGLAQGQRVAALLTDFTNGGMGGYAEVALAKAALAITLDEADDLASAAATIVNGATAFMAMEGLAPGATVAISGASGGLGQCLVAAAKASEAGAIIALSGSPARAATLSRLGATEILTPEHFLNEEGLIDAAFDTVGGTMRLHMLRRLRMAGRLVLLGNASGQDVQLSGDDIWLRSLRIEGLATGGLSPSMPDRINAAARRAIADARVRPPAFAVLDLEQAVDAHRMIENREGPGKLVLKVA